MENKSNTVAPFKPFPPALTKAIRRIMYPMVHLLLKTGMTFPQFSELLKNIYIDVADKHFRLNNKEQTQTRLSFLTGIHRKDVKRLHHIAQTSEEPENINVGVRLVSKWINEPRYLDERAKPLLLPLKANNVPSFEELVVSVCKQDIRPRVILDEWLHLGIVQLTDNKQVQLCTDAFIPKEGLEEKAYFVGHNIGDHLTAASKNLLSSSPEFFERCVYYDELSSESITELQDLMAEQGMTLLKKINERASQLKKLDSTKPNSKQRINIGLYLYHEDTEDEPKS